MKRYLPPLCNCFPADDKDVIATSIMEKDSLNMDDSQNDGVGKIFWNKG